MTFAQDTAVRDEGGKLAATLSRNWEIWGPNGGYVAAIALRAAGKVAPPDHRPATFSCQYLSAGQFADVEIAAEPVRKGRNAWCINVALVQAGKRFLQAQVWTTNKADGPEKIDRKMPDVPGPAALKSWDELNQPGTEKHIFWQNFEARPVRPVGWHNHDERGSVLREWQRYVGFVPDGDVFLDYARALLLIDTVQWPSWHRGLQIKPDYIAPSLDVTVWFHTPPGDARWLLLDARSDAASRGLIHGNVHVWAEDGRLIASGGSNMLHVARSG